MTAPNKKPKVYNNPKYKSAWQDWFNSHPSEAEEKLRTLLKVESELLNED